MPTADINEVRERVGKRRAGQKFVDKFPAADAAPETAPEFKKVQKEMHKRVSSEKMPHVSTGAYDPAMQEAPIGKRPAKFEPDVQRDIDAHEAATLEPAPAPKRQRQVRTDSFVFSMRIPAKYERVLTLEALDEQDAGTFKRKSKRETKLEYLEHCLLRMLEDAYNERPNPKKAKG